MLDEGRPADAIAAFAEAIEKHPGSAKLWNQMGVALHRSQLWEEAAGAYRTSLQLDPAYRLGWTNLASVLALRGLTKEAACELSKATTHLPDDDGLWHSLGVVLVELGEFERAEVCFRRALQIKPDRADTRIGRADNLYILSRHRDAREEYEKVPAAARNAIVRLRAARSLPAIPQSADEIQAERDNLERELDAALASNVKTARIADLGNTNFFLAYHGLDDRPLQEKWARFVLQACPAVDWTAPHCRRPYKRHRRRARVGVISQHLRSHTIALLTSGILQRLPRDRFEVVAFDIAAQSDPAMLADVADRVVTRWGGVEPVREAIAAEELDIAFYPEIGMNNLTFYTAFARLAPVQATTWGHPVTTGIPNVDYFLSSDMAEPVGAEAHYSERLVRLGRLPSYYFNPAQAPGPASGIPGFMRRSRSYFCPQSLFKLQPDFDRLVAGILDRDPEGIVVLLKTCEAHTEALKERLQRNGIRQIHRVVFMSRMARVQLLELMRACSVMIDPVHFGSGNTAYEGLSVGTPIVTLPGPFMRGRLTLSCYRQMGFGQCVASSPEEYIDMAVRIAREPEYRTALTQEILARNLELYEDGKAIHEMASFFESALAEAES